MTQPIFLKPVLQDKIWGGRKLELEFGLKGPSDTVGEAWCISAHPNGVSTVISPAEYAGLGLDQLYREHPELFGNPSQTVFPLLIKILDAAAELSVQVHPDDAYGLEHEGELGKTECWYVISAEPGAKIVYGHKAQSRQEFAELVAAGRWSDLLVEVPVKAGDFFDVPAGTIHAIGAGVVILETQQSSDTTYRVYDYDRRDAQGNPRDLHLKQAADVTCYPDPERHLQVKTQQVGDSQVIQYLENEFFTVTKWEVVDSLTLSLDNAYTLATVIAGQGRLWLDGVAYDLDLASSFILPHGVTEICLEGTLTLISSHPA